MPKVQTMKQFVLLSLFCALAQLPAIAQNKISTRISATQDQSSVVNGIAVIVNDEVITRQEVADRTVMIERRLSSQGTALPPRDELQRQIIERMIVDRAQLQLARDSGIKVDDSMLDRALLRMAEQNKMSLQNFRNQVEREGTTYAQFREEIRGDIIMQRLRERDVESKIQVSESEVDNYLLAQKTNTQANQELELSHILIRIPDNASPDILEKQRTRAASVLQQLRSGGDFSKLAAAYSDSAEGLKGGSLGWRLQERLPQLFIDAVTNLKTGDITGIIKSSAGFHILKLTGRRNATQSAEGVTQTHIRHILIKVSPTVTEEQARHKLIDLKQRLVNHAANFEELAKTFSNDSSASKGGDLGWIYPGDVPEFDAILANLQVGQISDPIQSSAGFHIIEVMERKTDEVSAERQRQLARQVIRERKRDEATLEWLRQLRDQAYVDIRPEDK